MFKLVSWDIAQQNIHDASGIDNPQDWLWSKLVGVYYPSMTKKYHQRMLNDISKWQRNKSIPFTNPHLNK